ncbi:membrane protein insertase YidC [Ruoffia tabacinasalis]|uniref:Membrane protein insertase YidC n=1 Tax=Ruoffia tabacinasalis TaxID=87458 RepID=A0ABS0LHV7_9LACT|nr:membrane protein insertase YidC [Ruoffia tabacinasalis]MBG9977885.1 membrane protein insertase YidC [Ruoffia tabacinasalis]
MKKKQKWLKIIGLLAVVILVMSGCVSYDSAGNPSGWVYEYIGRPASTLMDWIAGIFGGSYGVAIIIITIITRLLMMPSSVNMTKNSMISQSKMKIAQPEIDEINAEMEETSDQNEKAALQQELMQVYKKYDINMFGGLAGCLPLLIQMPIISAVYTAIRSSPEILRSNFLGINLGEQSIPLVIGVVLLYALQGWMMQKNTPQSDNPQAQQTSRTMMLMNPLMIGWITYASAAGLGIYFLTGGVFAIFQQLYMNKVVRPRIEKDMEAEAEKYAHVKRTPRKKATKAKNTNKGDSKRLVPTKNNVNTSNKKRRNEGKQRR